MNQQVVVEGRDGIRNVGAVDIGFRKRHRLRTAEGFSLVFADRRKLRGKIFDLHYRCQGSGAIAGPVGARLGIVIAKKLAQRAVQRNLLKRLAREIFRVVRRELPPYDLVLRLAKSPGMSLDRVARSIWRADIEQLMVRLPR